MNFWKQEKRLSSSCTLVSCSRNQLLSSAFVISPFPARGHLLSGPFVRQQTGPIKERLQRSGDRMPTKRCISNSDENGREGEMRHPENGRKTEFPFGGRGFCAPIYLGSNFVRPHVVKRDFAPPGLYAPM